MENNRSDPGEDGHVRVVEVKTTSGTQECPTVKIVTLDFGPEVSHVHSQDASQDQRRECGGTLGVRLEYCCFYASDCVQWH
jgi:hypothetical protein